jgi:hypothetical protein
MAGNGEGTARPSRSQFHVGTAPADDEIHNVHNGVLIRLTVGVAQLTANRLENGENVIMGPPGFEHSCGEVAECQHRVRGPQRAFKTVVNHGPPPGLAPAMTLRQEPRVDTSASVYASNVITCMGSMNPWDGRAGSGRKHRFAGRSVVSTSQTGSLLVPPNAFGRRMTGRLAGSSGLTDIPPRPGATRSAELTADTSRPGRTPRARLAGPTTGRPSTSSFMLRNNCVMRGARSQAHSTPRSSPPR